MDAVPEYLSLSLAAKLVGASTRAFRRHFVETKRVGYLPDDLWHDGTGRSYVRRGQLEQALDRRFTLAECQAAEGKLASRRAYQRAYRRRQKRNH